MIRTKEHKCPDCGNIEAIDTGNRAGEAHDLGSDGSYHEPTYPIMKCQKCSELFIWINN